MADPLTIIGTVAAVLDLAEYATKVVSTALTIYEAPRGTTLENAALEDVVSNMDALLNSPSIGLLEKSANESEESDDKEKPNLLRLAQQCQCVCKQIMDMLATMRIDKSKSKSKPIVFLECVKATAKTVWKKGRVIELRTDLDFVTSQLHLHYSLATGTETIDKLNDLMSKGDINSNALAKIRRDLKSLQDHGIRLEAGSMDDLRDLLGYSEKALRQRFQDRVLRSLKFGDMTNRFEDVPTAAAETFEWVIQGSHIPDSSHPNLSMSFRDWLENGAGIFHISGQPGAGKSTLMKFICQNKETRKCLESWAAPKQLVAANFFFWKPGTNLQKSLVGLIRGILHSTLKQVPSLIPLIFEDVWDPFNTQTWPNEGESPAGTPFSTTQDAIDTFERLFNLYAKDNLNGQRFCFFIDGLDEFDDPSEMHTMLAHRLKQWTLSWPDTLKFCVSSRPLPSFEDGFSLQQRIYLHFLTAGDIRSAIQGFLQKHPRFRLMDIIERDGIITAVVRQAQGIFLWVDLVKREIWNGLDNHDSFEELMAEIETFPQGLDEFLRHILCSIRASDHRTAWAIFSVVLEMGEIHDRPVYAYPRAIHYSYIRDYIRDPGSSRKLPVKKLTLKERTRRIDDLRVQLNGICKGLLHICAISCESFIHLDDSDPLFGQKVVTEASVAQSAVQMYGDTFIHRSIYDFVSQEWKRIQEDSSRNLSLIPCMIHCLICQVKQTELHEPVYFITRGILAFLMEQLSRNPPENEQEIFALMEELEKALLSRQNNNADDQKSVKWDHFMPIEYKANVANYGTSKPRLLLTSYLSASLRYKDYFNWCMKQNALFISDSRAHKELMALVANLLSADLAAWGRVSTHNSKRYNARMCLSRFRDILRDWNWEKDSFNCGWKGESILHMNLTAWQAYLIGSIVDKRSHCCFWGFLETFLEYGADPEMSIWGTVTSGQVEGYVGILIGRPPEETWMFIKAVDVAQPMLSVISEKGGRATFRDYVEMVKPDESRQLLPLIDRNDEIHRRQLRYKPEPRPQLKNFLSSLSSIALDMDPNVNDFKFRSWYDLTRLRWQNQSDWIKLLFLFVLGFIIARLSWTDKILGF